MRSPFPLPLRDALAETILAAFDDPAARAALAWLAAPDTPPAPAAAAWLARVHLAEAGALLAVHRPHAEAVHAHAARGFRATSRPPASPGGPALACALGKAAALWREGLYFEVHEVLEGEWARHAGGERQALQGLIQIAVALHHQTHGNPRGARKLFRDGCAHLAAAPDALPTVDVPALRAATTAWLEALVTGQPPAGPPPDLALRATPTTRRDA